MTQTLLLSYERTTRERRRLPSGAVRGAVGDEAAVVARVLDGDESAFATLLRRHHRQMVRLAGCYVDDRESAERIARDAWALALDRLETFDGTNSLKVWLAKVLAGCVSTLHRAPNEQEVSPACEPSGVGPLGPAIETRARRIGQRAIEALPPLQRKVLVLRDIDGWSSHEVSELLGIGIVEQRRLLHAARTEVCAAMQTYRAIVALDEVGR